MSNPIQDPVLGTITVYREYKPREDAIEYTTFFHRDGVKMRNDHTVTSSELEELPTDGNQAEDFIMSRIRADIEAGNYGEAHNYVTSREEKMREVPRDKQFTTEVDNLLSSNKKATGEQPSEAELIIITLLMRLYDLNYALLYTQNPTIADEVYESHNKGELGNPTMFIPTVSTPENVTEK